MREPDQIDMMNEAELRKQLRNVLKENAKLKKSLGEARPLKARVSLVAGSLEQATF